MIKCDECDKKLEYGGFPSIAIDFNGVRINFGVAHENFDHPAGLDKGDWCEACALIKARVIIQYPLWWDLPSNS